MLSRVGKQTFRNGLRAGNPGGTSCIFPKMQTTVLFLLLLSSTQVYGQQLVEGVVLDRKNGEAVIGAHVIGIAKNRSGTSTNSIGSFVLQSTDRLDSIRISCIGYKTLLVHTMPAGERLMISLDPYSIPLEALTVKPPSPQQIIADAVKSIPRNYFVMPFQLRGFYREIIRNDTTYYSVAEAVFESQLPEPGEDRALLKLVQGRRSESVKGTRIFEDYHPGGGPNYIVNHLLEAQIPEFLDNSNFEDYNYSIDSISGYEGRDVYVIKFDQRDGLKKNLWRGRTCVEAESLAIIDLRYALSDKGIEYRKHLAGTDKMMANLLGVDFTVLKRYNRYSYRKEGGRWQLHDASMSRDIHFVQPRKNIDETFTVHAQLLALGQRPGPLKPFDKSEVWRRNQLVKNLPGEFDEQFWGANNIIRPETSLVAAVERMDVLRSSTLASGAPAGWSLLRPEQAKVYQNGSGLLLKPYVTSRWKDKETGPFLWKTIKGDFEVTARVRVTRAQDTASAPDAGFQAGGLMIRHSGGSDENNIFFGIGCMGNPNLKIIGQQTLNGNTTVYTTKLPINEIVVRLKRHGSRVELHWLQSKQRTVIIREYLVAEWPEEIQVGVAGYTFVPGGGPKRKPDLLIKADKLEFR